MSALTCRSLTFVPLAFVALVAGTVPEQAGPFRALAFDAACAAAKGENKVVMIDFFTTWCGPCKKLDAVTWKDEAVVKWLVERTVALKIDAEQEADLAARFHLDAYPSLVFVQPDGKELGRLVGYKEPPAFLAAASELLAGVHASDRIKKQLEEKGWNSPMLRKEYAQELVDERRYEEALEHYLWCFDHGNEHDLAFAGVRLSFLLREITDLGAKHPQALVELRNRRDPLQKPLQEGTASLLQAAEFTSLNQYLGDARLTLEVYDKLASVEPQTVGGRRTRPQPTLFRGVMDLLIEDRRYADFLAGLGDPEKQFERDLAFEKMLDSNRGDAPEEMREILLASQKRAFVEKVGRVYEALLGARKDEQAARMLQRTLEYDNGSSSLEILAEHARRAGRPEIAETIDPRASEEKDE